MSKKDIKNVIKKLPELTNYGVGIDSPRRLSPIEREVRFRELQEALINNTEHFERACLWFGSLEKAPKVSKRSSYGLKHLAEKEIGYTSHGAFIAAGIHCGFRFEFSRFYHSAVFFNVSSKL